MSSEGVSFVIPGEAVPKGRPRVSRSGTYTPARTVAYRDQIIAAYLAASHRYNRDSEGRYGVMIDVFTASRRRTDVDNVAKAVLDGLNGVAFGDDSQVDILAISRVHIADREPYVSVTVRRIDDEPSDFGHK